MRSHFPSRWMFSLWWGNRSAVQCWKVSEIRCCTVALWIAWSSLSSPPFARWGLCDTPRSRRRNCCRCTRVEGRFAGWSFRWLMSWSSWRSFSLRWDRAECRRSVCICRRDCLCRRGWRRGRRERGWRRRWINTFESKFFVSLSVCFVWYSFRNSTRCCPRYRSGSSCTVSISEREVADSSHRRNATARNRLRLSDWFFRLNRFCSSIALKYLLSSAPLCCSCSLTQSSDWTLKCPLSSEMQFCSLCPFRLKYPIANSYCFCASQWSTR